MAKPTAMERALILSGGGARGAFQLGVIKYLFEKGWHPDLICGSSVGALNAAGLASGMSLDQMAGLWLAIRRKQVFRWTPAKFIHALLFRKKPPGLADMGALKRLLRRHIRLPNLRNSTIKVKVSAIDLSSSRLKFYDNHTITVEHLLASAAVPLFFPWQYFDGAAHWDGGLMHNTPIIPALEAGARDIIVVLLSPIGSHSLSLPSNSLEAAELVVEQLLIASHASVVRLYQTLATHYPAMNPLPQIATVAPRHMLGFKSLIHFSTASSRYLIQQGYRRAAEQLPRLGRQMTNP